MVSRRPWQAAGDYDDASFGHRVRSSAQRQGGLKRQTGATIRMTRIWSREVGTSFKELVKTGDRSFGHRRLSRTMATVVALAAGPAARIPRNAFCYSVYRPLEGWHRHIRASGRRIAATHGTVRCCSNFMFEFINERRACGKQ
jgi:hypothetical protein